VDRQPADDLQAYGRQLEGALRAPLLQALAARGLLLLGLRHVAVRGSVQVIVSVLYGELQGRGGGGASGPAAGGVEGAVRAAIAAAAPAGAQVSAYSLPGGEVAARQPGAARGGGLLPCCPWPPCIGAGAGGGAARRQVLLAVPGLSQAAVAAVAAHPRKQPCRVVAQQGERALLDLPLPQEQRAAVAAATAQQRQGAPPVLLAAAAAGDALLLELPASCPLQPGLLSVHVLQPGTSSLLASGQVLVLPDEAAAAELQQMSSAWLAEDQERASSEAAAMAATAPGGDRAGLQTGSASGSDTRPVRDQLPAAGCGGSRAGVAAACKAYCDSFAPLAADLALVMQPLAQPQQAEQPLAQPQQELLLGCGQELLAFCVAQELWACGCLVLRALLAAGAEVVPGSFAAAAAGLAGEAGARMSGVARRLERSVLMLQQGQDDDGAAGAEMMALKPPAARRSLEQQGSVAVGAAAAAELHEGLPAGTDGKQAGAGDAPAAAASQRPSSPAAALPAPAALLSPPRAPGPAAAVGPGFPAEQQSPTSRRFIVDSFANPAAAAAAAASVTGPLLPGSPTRSTASPGLQQVAPLPGSPTRHSLPRAAAGSRRCPGLPPVSPHKGAAARSAEDGHGRPPPHSPTSRGWAAAAGATQPAGEAAGEGPLTHLFAVLSPHGAGEQQQGPGGMPAAAGRLVPPFQLAQQPDAGSLLLLQQQQQQQQQLYATAIAAGPQPQHPAAAHQLDQQLAQRSPQHQPHLPAPLLAPLPPAHRLRPATPGGSTPRASPLSSPTLPRGPGSGFPRSPPPRTGTSSRRR
jgi:hypothetical protein